MVKLLKRLIVVIAVITITLNTSININADVKSSKFDDIGVTYEELQILFPYLDLKETWTIGNNIIDACKNTSSHDIINTYQAEYDDGEC